MGAVVLSREYGEDPQRRQVEAQLLAELERQGMGVMCAPHLYHVAESDPLWEKLADMPRPVVFAGWLHERPMRWLLARHGIAGEGVVVIELSQSQDAPAAARAICESCGQPAPGAITNLAPEPAKARWYPVMDKSRCTDCGHCFQFCLFGVYSMVDGKVVANNPDACKSGCPACSRICPRSAIMFPLYKRDEAIAGATGKLVQVDDAARKMYEQRTGKQYEPAPSEPAFDDLNQLVAELDSFAKDRQR